MKPSKPEMSAFAERRRILDLCEELLEQERSLADHQDPNSFAAGVTAGVVETLQTLVRRINGEDS